MPPFYAADSQQESPKAKYFQKLGGDTIALVMFNYCEYYSRNVQCHFCEIHENYQHHEAEIIKIKRPELMADSLVEAIRQDPSIKQIIFNSGNYSRDNNRTFEEIIKTIKYLVNKLNEEELSKIALLVIVSPPENLELLRDLKEAGATSIYVNMEVWEECQFMRITPGKYQVGRDNFFKVFDEGLNCFGKGYVYTNLIFGLQSLKMGSQGPYFDPKAEFDILSGALEELISRDVLLTNTIYHSSGKNKIGKMFVPEEAILDFHLHYGQEVWKSGLVSDLCDKKNAVYASFEAMPNSLNNEPFALFKFNNQGVCA